MVKSDNNDEVNMGWIGGTVWEYDDEVCLRAYVCDHNSIKAWDWSNETIYDDYRVNLCGVIPYIMKITYLWMHNDI